MARRRQADGFFRGFVEEAEKIAREEKEEGSPKEKGKQRDRLLATKTLGIIGAGAGAVPGGAHHIGKVRGARREWAKMTPGSTGFDPEIFKTMKHVRTRLDVPSLIRRSLGGAAAGLTVGALSGALADYIRRKRQEK